MTPPPERPGGPGPAAGLAGRLPPGQRQGAGWPVQHYGRVPRAKLHSWDLHVTGATARPLRLDWTAFGDLPQTEVTADLHCVTRFSVLGLRWSGVSTAALLALSPPDPSVTSVLVAAEYGYTANLALQDFAAPDALLATHCDGEPLAPEHGFPVRLVVPHLYAWKGPKWVRGLEWLTEDRPGFWEQRGYHGRGDAWREERYAHQG